MFLWDLLFRNERDFEYDFERRLQLFVREFLPWVVLEPNVVLDFSRPVQPQPIVWLPLNESIDEVCSLKGPAIWDLVLFNLHLFRQNLIPDFLPSLPHIRPLLLKPFQCFLGIKKYSSVHALVSNDSHCVIIYRDPMVLATNNLWCHVTRGPGSI